MQKCEFSFGQCSKNRKGKYKKTEKLHTKNYRGKKGKQNIKTKKFRKDWEEKRFGWVSDGIGIERDVFDWPDGFLFFAFSHFVLRNKQLKAVILYARH